MGKELKHSFIYRIGHTPSGFHVPLGYGSSPLVSTHQGLTLHLFFERQKTEVKKNENKLGWITFSSLLCEFTSI